MEDERTHLLALAGLLHDVGKFMLRASVGGQLDWRTPENQQEFAYKHAMLTDTFVAEAVPEPWRAGVRGPAGRHHRPQNHDEQLIQLADHLSAGERDDLSAEVDEAPRAKHPQQLLSVFCRVVADGLVAANPAYVPLRPLELARESLFPAFAQALPAGTAVTAVHIPIGQNNAELWRIFSVVSAAVEPEASVAFDITHGLRSFPLIGLLAAAYLRASRNADLAAVLYGAYDVRDKSVEPNRTPVFDLSPMLGLLEWATAADRFNQTGDAGMRADPARPKELISQIRACIEGIDARPV